LLYNLVRYEHNSTKPEPATVKNDYDTRVYTLHFCNMFQAPEEIVILFNG